MRSILFPTEEVRVPIGLAPSQVLREIEKLIAINGWRDYFRERLAGSVSDDRIRLRRLRMFSRNDLSGEFSGTVNGMQIEGRFRAPVAARIFIGGWLLVILVIFAPVQVGQVRRDGWTRENVELTVSLTAMLVVGALAPRLGWWLGRGDRAYVREKLLLAGGKPPAA